MARSEARIFTRIWQDRDFTERPADVQRLYFLILSQPGLSFCGVVAHQPKRWARMAPDTSVKAVGKALDQLVAHRFVVVDDDTEELWVRSFVKNDGAVKNDNLLLALARDFEAIASPSIREGVTNAVAEALTKRFPNGPDDALVNRVLDRVGDGMLKAVAYAFPDGLLTRVRAQSPTPTPAPSPPPRSPARGSRTPSAGGTPADTSNGASPEVAGDGAPAEEEIASLEERVCGVAGHLAAQDLERHLETHDVRNRASWLREATKRRLGIHESEARALLGEGRSVAQTVVALGGDDPDDPDGSVKAEARAEATRRRAAEAADEQRAADAEAAEADALIAELDDDEREALRTRAEASVSVVGGRRAEVLVTSAMRRLVREGAS